MTIITTRTKRYITKALEASLGSDYTRVKIGAVIVDGNFLVASAANCNRSHPRQAELNRKALRVATGHCLHAEVHALIRSGNHDLSRAELYVGRFDRTGQLGNCKPCVACQIAIKEAGIKATYYTHPEGIKAYAIV